MRRARLHPSGGRARPRAPLESAAGVAILLSVLRARVGNTGGLSRMLGENFPHEVGDVGETAMLSLCAGGLVRTWTEKGTRDRTIGDSRLSAMGCPLAEHAVLRRRFGAGIDGL